MLMNLYGCNNKYYTTLNNDIMQDFWHKLILPQLQDNTLEPIIKMHSRYTL